jgi:16S rRNA (guanine(966)-N(2))-methyltransferase RsmD
MRIIAGTLKGRRLAGPRTDGVRPTSDSLRETLFNILGARVPDARVLDGYAGTGGVGLEALSRGAAAVTFVERDRRTSAVLGRNVETCGVDARSAIVCADFLDARAAHAARGPFDVVFVDPPYEGTDLAAIAEAAASVATSAGIVIVEHSRRRASPEHAGAFARVRLLTAGDSALSFYTAPAPR